MQSRCNALFCVLLCILSTGVLAAAETDPTDRPFWRERQRGWHFYEEMPPDGGPPAPPTPAAPPAPVAPAAAPATPAPQPPELAEFARLQKLLEELRTVAIVRPTQDNVRRYMAQEALVVDRASQFADMAQRIAWQSPELDPTLQGGRAVNARALDVSERALQDNRASTMRRLASSHALFFFYRSDCPYCHAFAPIVAQFGQRWGITILPISLDGGTLPEFPASRPDNGIATTLRVQQVPAVYLAEPGAGHITPVAFGVLSEAQLLERITALVGSPDADPGAVAGAGTGAGAGVRRLSTFTSQE